MTACIFNLEGWWKIKRGHLRTWIFWAGMRQHDFTTSPSVYIVCSLCSTLQPNSIPPQQWKSSILPLPPTTTSSCPITNPYYSCHINCGSGNRLRRPHKVNRRSVGEEIGGRIVSVSSQSPEDHHRSPTRFWTSSIFSSPTMSFPTQHNNSWKVDNY